MHMRRCLLALSFSLLVLVLPSCASAGVTPAPAPSPVPGLPPLPGALTDLQGKGSPLEIGLVASADPTYEPGRLHKLAAPIARMEFSIGTPAARLRPAFAAFAATGTRLVPLAGFQGRIPTVAQARSLAEWAREFGPGGTFWQGRADGDRFALRQIEFGSETSYNWQFPSSQDNPRAIGARARKYAQRAKVAIDAINAANPGVGLLLQADDANTGKSTWVDGMFRAVPNLGNLAAGWTVHPYGVNANSTSRLERLVSQTRAHGAPDLGIWVTEYGISTDNGRCLSDNYGWGRCLTYAQAGANLISGIAAMRAAVGDRLRAVMIYNGRDNAKHGRTRDREGYFGVLQSNGADKGLFTAAVRTLIEAARH
jgi:hypothetical protein